MNENDFEGTLVLEQLARIDKIDEFMAAVDSEDIEKAAELMDAAGIDQETIDITIRKILDPYDEH